MNGEIDGFIYSVEFQMSLLLFMALGGYLVSNRIGQPAVVGVIFAGILIGPSGLDIIQFSDFISNIGHIGAIILLFAIGLESHIRIAMKPSCFLIAAGGVLLPWIGGYFIASVFGFGFTSAIITGVAMTATSLAITADTLRELGKMQSHAAQAIIGAAVIDDVLALLALTVSNHLSTGTLEPLIIILFLLKAAFFLIGGFWFGRRVFVPLISYVDQSYITSKYPDFVFIMTMKLSFLYAMLAELVGLSAIIGAFVAGIALANVKIKYSKDFRKGTEFLRIIFGAIFFISIGVLTDIRQVTWDMVGFIIALAVTAFLSKFIGCGLMAKLSGMKNRDCLIIGVGMAPRGETAMVIALLAYVSKAIEQPVFVALIIISIITTMVTPILLKNWLYRIDIIKDWSVAQERRPRTH